MARTKVSAKFVAGLAYATFCIRILTQDLVPKIQEIDCRQEHQQRGGTEGRAHQNAWHEAKVHVLSLRCCKCQKSERCPHPERRRPREEEEENGEEEENEVMSEDEQREEEPKKLAAPARRCVQSTFLTPPCEPLITLPVAWDLTFCPTYQSCKKTPMKPPRVAWTMKSWRYGRTRCSPT